MSQHFPFDHRHYVPMLRGKTAEFDALKALTTPAKDRLTPLVEIPTKELSPDDPAISEKIDAKFKHFVQLIEKSWGSRRLFLDLGHLDCDVRGVDSCHPVEVMWREAELICLFPPTPIPVVSLTNDDAFRDAVRAVVTRADEGYCLRLFHHELLAPNFPSVLAELLHFFGLAPAKVDLIIDFGLVDETGLDLASAFGVLPFLQQWRTLTTVGGSFPVDLQGLDVGEHLNPRWEWRRYRDQLAHGHTLERIPTFGDYTIQHPIYIEPVDGARPSASVRYSCAEDILIMRGESPSKEDSGGYKQYPAHAVMLCDRTEFRGPHFSQGDAFIAQKAALFEVIAEMDKGGTGGPRQWLYAGINHHLTLVPEQVSALFAL